MADIDKTLMGRLLLHVEADAHRRGWDGPAAIHVLYDWTDHDTEYSYRHLMALRRGAPTRCGGYAAQSAVPEAALAGHPVHALFRFALNLRDARGHEMIQEFLDMIRQPGFLGVAFSYEAWYREYETQEARDADGKVRFADMPGSLEVRGVIGADIEGNDYSITRVRGQKPRLDHEHATKFEGAAIDALRVITAVIAEIPVPELRDVPSQWEWPSSATDHATPDLDGTSEDLPPGA